MQQHGDILDLGSVSETIRKSLMFLNTATLIYMESTGTKIYSG